MALLLCNFTSLHLGGKTSQAGVHDDFVHFVRFIRLEREGFHRDAVALPAAPSTHVRERVALFFHVAGEIHLDQAVRPDVKSHDSEGVDDSQQKEDVAKQVQEDIDSPDDLHSQVLFRSRTENVLDVLLDKGVEEVEHEGDDEVLVGHSPQRGNVVPPELTGDDAHLGHILDGPAVSLLRKLASSKARGLLLLRDDALVGHCKSPSAVAATTAEDLQPIGGSCCLLVAKQGLGPVRIMLRSVLFELLHFGILTLFLCLGGFFIRYLLELGLDVVDETSGQDRTEDDEQSPVKMHPKDASDIGPTTREPDLVKVGHERIHDGTVLFVLLAALLLGIFLLGVFLLLLSRGSLITFLSRGSLLSRGSRLLRRGSLLLRRGSLICSRCVILRRGLLCWSLLCWSLLLSRSFFILKLLSGHHPLPQSLFLRGCGLQRYRLG
mmetsp:Transcript_7099/g.14134  ORF Transcript_7099/g.14134 Transcript_7099/m.14134 type:complete len:436 (+) Transcript_7099:142-1449(+)